MEYAMKQIKKVFDDAEKKLWRENFSNREKTKEEMIEELVVNYQYELENDTEENVKQEYIDIIGE
ncbi:MAG: hypothetical protein ACE5H1_01990 [Thermodesulfobacteriota bacterium]